MRHIPVKPFHNQHYYDEICLFTENMIGVEFEKACLPIALNILTNYEGFKGVEEGPALRGRPFDLFGYKHDIPYIIEVKGSLKRFQAPGELQKQRLQKLLHRVEKLPIALLQIKVRTAEYRILYDEDVIALFQTRYVSLDPLVAWIKERIH